MAKREDILDAALVLFAERGFYGTPVPLIAARAGVGAGTIYRYFESKEKLVNVLYQHWKQKFYEATLGGLPTNLPVRQLFHAVWERMVDFARHNRAALIFLELHHHAPYLDQASCELTDCLSKAFGEPFAQALRDQVLKDISLELQQGIFWGIFMGMMTTCWRGLIDLTPEVIAQTEESCWQALRR